MNQLTQEQKETLETTFASYPETYEKTIKYATMEGIHEQLNQPRVDDDGNQYICYISNVKLDETTGEHNFSINKMYI